ncbi:MAG TPA: DUF4272 domain-containing protein, partial [Puia sp.]
MENYTLYSHAADFDLLLTAVKKALPKLTPVIGEKDGIKTIYGVLKSGLLGKKSEFRINYRSVPSEQLAGLGGYVASIPARDEGLKKLLLQKIGGLRSETAFMAEPSMSPGLQGVLIELAEGLDALVFAQPGLSFSDSKHQHFLDRTFNLILDSEGNSGKGKIGVVFETLHLNQQGPVSEEQTERKARTIELLKARGVKVNEHLPPVPDVAGTTLRSKEEVIGRVYALLLVTAKGEGVERERLESLRVDKAISGLSPAEQTQYEKDVLEGQERVDALWRYESLNVLLWALGLVEELVYPSSVCDFAGITRLLVQNTRDWVLAAAQLREVAVVLEELDKVYRMHWACVDARIHAQEPPGDLDSSVVYERHYALK